MKVGIIGAGIGGIAAAIRMAIRGHEVTVYEKNDYPGGKMTEIFRHGFRFDTGPSLFTLPNLLNELFDLCGEKMESSLPHHSLEINCRYFYPDKTIFNFYHDKEKWTEEVRVKTNEKPDRILKRLRAAKELYEISAPVFIFSSFHRLSNFNTPPYKKLAFRLHKLDFFRTIHQANKHLFDDKKIIQLFDRYATYNGSNPYSTPATLNMIAHLENNIGAFFPAEGMAAIIKNLYRMASRLNVSFRFRTKVEHIEVENHRATGIVTSAGKENFDIVISAIDARYTAERLLAHHPFRKRLARLEPSSSALIFYWGMNRTFPQLDLHNILFSKEYRKEFQTLFKKKRISEDPTIYIFISSKQVVKDAPQGCENWFVMVNAPSRCDGQNWEMIIHETRENMIEKINRTLETDIRPNIVCEDVSTPLTIEQNTGSVNGALYGPSSNSMLSAFLRHPNFLNQIKNLYFVGGSVHPGGGIPLCLASAKIVEQEIVRDGTHQK